MDTDEELTVQPAWPRTEQRRRLNPELQAAIAARRADTAFATRLAKRIEYDRDRLERLARS